MAVDFETSENMYACWNRVCKSLELLKPFIVRDLGVDYHLVNFEMDLHDTGGGLMVGGWDTEPFEHYFEAVRNHSDFELLKEQFVFYTKELIAFYEQFPNDLESAQKCITTFSEFLQLIPKLEKLRIPFSQRVRILLFG